MGPISSSPSWFIAASTVVLTLTLMLKKELPFYRSFFSPSNYWRVSILWHYDPANVVILNSVRVLIKRSKYLGTIINGDFIMLCEKQLKSKILKTALKKNVTYLFFVSTISIKLMTTWSKLSIAIISIYSLINLSPFLWYLELKNTCEPCIYYFVTTLSLHLLVLAEKKVEICNRLMLV